MARYVAILRFADDEARRLETRPRHREYLKGLAADGKIDQSGPFGDDTGALIVYDVADEAEARALLAADPYTESGVIADATIKAWNRVLPAE